MSTTTKPVRRSHSQAKPKEFFDEWCALYGIGEHAASWLRTENVTSLEKLSKLKAEHIFDTAFIIPYDQRCVLRGALLQFKIDKHQVLAEFNKRGVKLTPTKKNPVAASSLSQNFNNTEITQESRNSSANQTTTDSSFGSTDNDLGNVSSRSTSLGNISAKNSDISARSEMEVNGLKRSNLKQSNKEGQSVSQRRSISFNLDGEEDEQVKLSKLTPTGGRRRSLKKPVLVV